MIDFFNYIITIFLKIHLYIFYILCISFIIEKITSLHLLIKHFFIKKTFSMAKGAALNFKSLYFIFGIAVLGYNLFYLKNSPDNVPKWILFIFFSIIYYQFARLLYWFYFHFQGRKQPTELRKRFNKRYRKFKKKINIWPLRSK